MLAKISKVHCLNSLATSLFCNTSDTLSSK